MALLLKDNPSVWEELYQSNAISPLDEIGFSDVEEIKIELTDTPAILRSLEEQIHTFWEEFTNVQPKARNDLKYGLRGLEDVEKNNTILTVRVFPTNYATIRFKNSRGEKYNARLTAEQREFLEHHFVTPGAMGYITIGEDYLMGVRAGPGARVGLTENVPSGLLDPPDNFTTGLARELHEETNLALEQDIAEQRLTHINHGPKYGDFTLIYKLQAYPTAREKAHPNPEEHTWLFWENLNTIKDTLAGKKRYTLNPVAAALFEKL